MPYHRLSDIFAEKILPTYYEALKKITGVYCLTDTHTGKLHIGSATGGEGVAQRWGKSPLGRNAMALINGTFYDIIQKSSGWQTGVYSDENTAYF